MPGGPGAVRGIELLETILAAAAPGGLISIWALVQSHRATKIARKGLDLQSREVAANLKWTMEISADLRRQPGIQRFPGMAHEAAYGYLGDEYSTYVLLQLENNNASELSDVRVKPTILVADEYQDKTELGVLHSGMNRFCLRTSLGGGTPSSDASEHEAAQGRRFYEWVEFRDSTGARWRRMQDGSLEPAPPRDGEVKLLQRMQRWFRDPPPALDS